MNYKQKQKGKFEKLYNQFEMKNEKQMMAKNKIFKKETKNLF